MTQKNPFRLTLQPAWLAGLIAKLLKLDVLAGFYDEWLSSHAPIADKIATAQQFVAFTLNKLGVVIEPSDPARLQVIPATGPVLVVSNHPLGGVEGMAMTVQLLARRPDLKVMTTALLTKIPELSDCFVGVDNLSGQSVANNARAIKQLNQHIQAGGAVLMYPSGIVSIKDFSTGLIADPPWTRLVASLAKKSAATVVPCFVEARNSDSFYRAGLIHKRLRTVMLIREMLNKSGQTFRYEIGDAIAPKEYQDLDHTACTDYFRLAADSLRPAVKSGAHADAERTGVLTPVDAPPSDGNITAVTQQLATISDCSLLQQGEFEVFCAPYERLGVLMDEIACAREETFRTVGEGSGKASDSDRFDPHYDHLFVWDHQRNKMVGGYRLGRVDQIVAQYGIDALYSRSLYHFDQQYVTALGQSLEVGRSFVTPTYQRFSRALDLLWQGIGRYIVRHPEYYLLFGCVSISHEYSQLARAFLSESMMTAFKARESYLADIRPLKPLVVKGKVWTDAILHSLTNIAVINQVVGRLDAGKSVPVLLRHYLSLNGRFVCFSVNEQFQDSLDGLIIVDLRETPAKYLKRYIGKTESVQLLAQWEERRHVA